MTTNEQQEYAALLDLVGHIKRLETDGDRWDLAAPGSDLFADDQLMAPLQTSHLVGHALGAAVDHLRGVRFLLVDGSSKESSVRLLMLAHYPLLRSALEASALAAWLLRPDDQHERLARSVQARWSEVSFEHQMIQAMTEADPGDDKAKRSRKQKGRRDNARPHASRKRRVRTIAEKLGIPEATITAMPRLGEIVADAAIGGPVAPSTARGTWNMLSGLTHPSVTRMISVSDMEIVSSTDDVHHARFTTKMSTLIASVIGALMMTEHAKQLLELRGGDPTRVI